jgi:pyrimidine operon attenuation protein/uracil phosphoribosyltransferase
MSERVAGEEQIGEAVDELAARLNEIVANPGGVAFIGIHTHGVPLAKRLQAKFDASHSTQSPFGTLDINLYRDGYDLRGVKPRIQNSEIRFSVDKKEVILVDDVLYTGRTIRSAIEALGDYGRPAAIRLLVLADRGHRELPIQPDAAGFTLATERNDRVKVRMKEIDGTDEILLVSGGNP